jgi:hypothetical protein
VWPGCRNSAGPTSNVLTHYDVAYWHLADNHSAAKFVRYWSNSGQNSILARDGLSANDPKRTFNSDGPPPAAPCL